MARVESILERDIRREYRKFQNSKSEEKFWKDKEEQERKNAGEFKDQLDHWCSVAKWLEKLQFKPDPFDFINDPERDPGSAFSVYWRDAVMMMNDINIGLRFACKSSKTYVEMKRNWWRHAQFKETYCAHRTNFYIKKTQRCRERQAYLHSLQQTKKPEHKTVDYKNFKPNYFMAGK